MRRRFGAKGELMQVTNCGRGIHAREIKGIELLKTALPSNWYAFTNLELAVGPGQSREIDVVAVGDDRIFLIDLKDWSGKITSQNGDWYQNGVYRCSSPVGKIAANARELGLVLGDELRRRRGKDAVVPRVFGLVIITGSNADFSDIAPNEAASVMKIADFLKSTATASARIKNFGGAHPAIVADPLTSVAWKDQLSKFFNARTGKVRPGRRRYGNFLSLSDDASYQHPQRIYSEYEAADEHAASTLGTLRVWDFTKADTKFQSEEGRREIAGRERSVVAYLQDRNDRNEHALLLPKAEDPERGVSYWEVYDRRRRLKRLSEFAGSDWPTTSPAVRLELARQLLANVASIHSSEAAHLDIGSHSVWLEAPSTARLSHLMAARFLEDRSLGESRYQFLSSAILPEDIIGGGGNDAARRDVFLLGVCVHHIVFGHPPKSETPDMPPQWNPAVDELDEYAALHGWFEAALSLAPSDRFSSGTAALDAFNAATASRPTKKEVLEGLETFRTGAIKSQRQLFSAYPTAESITELDRLEVWRSDVGGKSYLVKLWKREAWGDQEREGPRILAFLLKAQDLVLSPPPGCAPLVDVMWLGDSLAVVQEYVPGENLSSQMRSETLWADDSLALSFLKELAETVIDLHSRGIAHGDLKPSNIIVVNDGRPSPVLIDLVDFSSSTDGDVTNSAYSPATGGNLERDRYAVSLIASELLEAGSFSPSVISTIRAGIEICQTSILPNATLLPLLEALDSALAPTTTRQAVKIRISITGAETGTVYPDEGRFFLRQSMDKKCVLLRGAAEEIEVTLDESGKPTRARRMSLDQKRIGAVSRFEFMNVEADINVVSSATTDLSSLEQIFALEEFLEALKPQPKAAPDQTETESEDQDEEAEVVEGRDGLLDVQARAVALEVDSGTRFDLGSLWRKLVDAEADLTTEGVAIGESVWDNGLKRHIIPFELSNGTFDFSRADTVGVERLGRKGGWKRIGELDIARSKPDRVLIDASDYSSSGGQLVEAEQMLRFISHFEMQSFKRRESAISRVLSRRARIPELIDIFDPARASKPQAVKRDVDDSDLDLYGLNPAQKVAFRNIVSTRPLGLVQGPPGTGKTVFIAALAHYALSHNLARNILLASQSHEAVNNAAESVLRLFLKDQTQPRILRVGNESVVSDRLLQFHTEKVEQLYKDRFSAELRDRLRIGAAALGLPVAVADAVIHVETVVKPVMELVAKLQLAAEPDSARINGLYETVELQLAHLALEAPPRTDEPVDVNNWVREVVDCAVRGASAGETIDASRVGKMRAIALLASDFVRSTSTPQRGFEPFLAGTRQIVAGTCVGLGRPSLGLTSTPFDLVIIDEAARCTASELSVPMQAGRWVVLVGDHAQLEPLHDATLVKQVSADLKIPQRDVLKSDFERVFKTDYGRAAGQTLKTQYRMLPPIGRVVSTAFYGGALVHGRDMPEVDAAALPAELAVPFTWIATEELGAAGFQKRDQYSTSLTNPVEASIIVGLIQEWSSHKGFTSWLEQQKKYSQPIGIIAMYAAQRDLIRRQLDRAPLPEFIRKAIKVDTVDSYQGKENPIVLLSLVRNNADGPQEDGAATIDPGFLVRPNRINVAVSRAMDRLLIVGGLKRWGSGTAMGDMRAAFYDEIALESPGAVVLTPSDLTLKLGIDGPNVGTGPSSDGVN